MNASPLASPLASPVAVGLRVSYEDMANPRRTGTVTAVNESRWGMDYTVVWDEPYTIEAEGSYPEVTVRESRSDLAQYGWKTVSK